MLATLAFLSDLWVGVQLLTKRIWRTPKNFQAAHRQEASGQKQPGPGDKAGSLGGSDHFLPAYSTVSSISLHQVAVLAKLSDFRADFFFQGRVDASSTVHPPTENQESVIHPGVESLGGEVG